MSDEDKREEDTDGGSEGYTEDIPCCRPEKTSLPDGREVDILVHEDGMSLSGRDCTISIQEKDGFERIHDWDHYTREVLNNILMAIEEKQRLGYFDSLIDVETNCNLINMARAIYVDLFNENKDGSRFRNPHMKITKEDIDKQCRGGYSTEFTNRMYDLLVNDGDTNA